MARRPFGAVAITTAVLAYSFVLNLVRGGSWRGALPAGYGLSLVGAFLFLAGGLFDFAWHTLFGIEVNIEALLSPSHLILMISAFLLLGGPLRAAWARLDPTRAQGWGELGPMVMSATVLLSIITFFTQFSHPLTSFSRQGSLGEAYSIGSILLQTLLLMGFVLILVSRWRLPFGSLTALILVNGALMTVFRDRYVFLPGVLITGLLADVLLRVLQPGLDRPLRTYLFAFAVPVVFYALYFFVLLRTLNLGWSIHLCSARFSWPACAGCWSHSCCGLRLARAAPQRFPQEGCQLEIRDAKPGDASAIARIYNQGIEDRVATLETTLRTREERAVWLASRSPRHPVFVASDGAEVLGWGSLNPFNPRPAYDHAADFSVYVAREHRGKGVGGHLLSALVDRATTLGYHKLVLAGFPWNQAAMALYEKHGFRRVGTYREHGWLDGKWVDVVVMEKILG